MQFFQGLKMVFHESHLFKLLSTGFVAGAVIGFKDCDVNDNPLLTERIVTAFGLGVIWSGQCSLLPLELIMKLDNEYHNRKYDPLGKLKDSHRLMTGSWRHDLKKK